VSEYLRVSHEGGAEVKQVKPGEVITARHVWNKPRHRLRAGGCGCWFCRPENYPPIPPGCALCGRCGALMGARDPVHWRLALECCNPCEAEMKETP
jgi:hypothetical protein